MSLFLESSSQDSKVSLKEGPDRAFENLDKKVEALGEIKIKDVKDSVYPLEHRLFTILVSIGIPIPRIQQEFHQNLQQRIPLDIFERSHDYWLDITHPRHVNRESFLFAGLSYSLSEIDIDFVDKGLRNIFTSEAFFEENNIKYQITSLLNDTTLAKNGLNSFLAGDIRANGLSVLFEKEDAEKLSSLALSKLAEQFVNSLSEDSNNLRAWMHLYAVCGSFPPYESLFGKLKEIILKTNFANLVQEDLKNGGSVILVASQQAINLADQDVCNYLRDQLVKISELLANRGINETSLSTNNKSDSNIRGNICIFLLDSALNISIALQSSEGIVTEFKNIIIQLIDSCNSLAPIFRPIIQRLCEELPSSQAKNLWPLLVRLRAE